MKVVTLALALVSCRGQACDVSSQMCARFPVNSGATTRRAISEKVDDRRVNDKRVPTWRVCLLQVMSVLSL